MPGPILPNTGIQLPALGGDAGVWDEENNACWMDYDTHDHAAGNGVRVPVTGLNINADLPMGGFGFTNVKSVAFAQIAALAAGAVTLFVNAADHELYWRTNAGANVKLTNGASINTTLVGGIVGDYAAVGAEVAYDDANDRYTFKQQGAKPWARLASGDVRLYEYNTVEVVYTGLKVAAALAASYDITMPVALPASQVLVQMDAAGNLIVSNTLANNTDITLQGTGKIKHGTWKKAQVFKVSFASAGAFSGGVDGNGGTGCAIAAAGSIGFAQLDGLHEGDIISAVDITNSGLITGVGNVTYDVIRYRGLLGVTGSMLAAPVASGAAAVALAFNAPITVADGDTFYVKVTLPGAGTYAFYSIGTSYSV